MKNRIVLLCMCLCMVIFTACSVTKDDIGNDDSHEDIAHTATRAEPDGDADGVTNEVTMGDGADKGFTQSAEDERTVSSESVIISCRVVDAADGVLLLAGIDGRAGDVYRVGTKDVDVSTESGEVLPVGGIESGSLVEITYSGFIMETFPAQLGDVTGIKVMDLGGFDNLCSLYLDVLEDLWEVDNGLNSDITELGVDLSKTRLTPAEQSALAWHFGKLHGITEVVEGTWQELVEQGYINGDGLYWENGCLFSITEKDMEGTYSLNTVTFDAEKWRSGNGAYFFMDCTSVQSALGKWGEYRIGGQAIS